MSGRLVILSGPSGVGKDTVIDAWIQADPRVRRIVAYTTRPPRPCERDGIDYRFVSPERFQTLAREGAFLERKEVHGAMYATPLADLDQTLNEGFVAVLKIDVQGAIEVMAKRKDALSVFLAPPSREELERRLLARGTEDAAAAARRLRTALLEMEYATHYQHVLVNDDVERVVAELIRLSSEGSNRSDRSR